MTTEQRSGRLLSSRFGEALVIVASILLAFAIDAAWSERDEVRRREELVAAIRQDVRATREQITQRAAWARGVIGKARGLLEAVGRGARGAALEERIRDIGDVFVKGYWSPINHSYDQALGSGDLALVEDPELRLRLGRYVGKLRSFGRLQDNIVTQYYGQLEPFMVAWTDYAQVAWTGEAEGLVQTPFGTDAEALAESREFANLLNLKLEIELEVLSGLDELESRAEALLEILE